MYSIINGNDYFECLYNNRQRGRVLTNNPIENYPRDSHHTSTDDAIDPTIIVFVSNNSRLQL